MTRNEINLLANQLIYKHSELSMWRFGFSNKKASYGTCYYKKRIIALSSYFVDSMTDEAIKDTLIHEIAHALTPGRHHDWVWRRKCIELGGNGQVRGSAKEFLKDNVTLESKYSLVCPCCGKITPIHRKPKRIYSCGKCSPNVYNENFKMTLQQNY